MPLLGVGPERAPVPELGPERVQVPVQVLVPERAPVPVRALALVAGLALVLSRKREAKYAARCRPEPDWQCC